MDQTIWNFIFSSALLSGSTSGLRFGPRQGQPRNITRQVVGFPHLPMAWPPRPIGCPQPPLFPWLVELLQQDMVHQNS